MLAPQPFFEPRGTPLSIYQRLQALSALGHHVDLVTYHVGKDVHFPNVQIHRIPRVPYIKDVKVGPSWIKPFLDLLLFFKAGYLLLTTRYDAIHTHEEAAFMGVFFAWLFKIRHVYDMHSSLPHQLQNFNFGNWPPLVRLFEMLERLTLRRSDAVITIGSDLEQLVRRINPDANLFTVENLPFFTGNGHVRGEQIERLRQELQLVNRSIVVYTGTFERYQGLDLLLKSAEIVVKQDPKVSFVLVGGKPQQVEKWQETAVQQGIAAHVQFVGTVPPEQAAQYMALAEILVSPRIDGTSVPLKIYSYLYAGKPTIATNLVAHSQVLNEDIAYLIEPTSEALAEGILRLLQDSDLRQRLGKNARLFAEARFSYEHYLDKMRQVYHFNQPHVELNEKTAPVLK
ncbi:MAG TPA: glycosyltransferase family 4 protein [Chloroflexota bacterium]|nr:glycosyltransferase family 4 protein [Chloroflexota bacterium]HUM68061.1 glycosyltransferase family 4 protein [Chloroflexota bacterium]